MAKVALFILSGALAFGGVIFIRGCREGGRDTAEYESHLAVIAGQLADLKDMLGEYRRSHGRYPTNDEGLSVLDTFAGRFKAPSSERPTSHPLYRRYFWEKSQDDVCEYRERTGHAPASAEDWIAVLDIMPADVAAIGLDRQVEIGIGPQDNVFFLGPAGALSPWMLPYVYENRNGLPAEAFAGSPANDGDERYGAKVDEGIYVSAVGGRELVRRMREAWWERNTPRFMGVGLIVLAVVIVGVWLRSEKLLGGALITLLGSAFLGYGASKAFSATCYYMSPLFSDRPAELVSQQQELLRKYHAAGVITDATYARSLEAIDSGPATQPATQPTTKP